VFLLASRGYGSPFWLTYKQAAEQCGTVRRGEHGSKIVFWRIDKYETEDAEGQSVRKSSAILRYYTVFNIEQCDGIAIPQSKPVVNPIAECERIVAGMPNPPAIVQDARAWYRPSNDTVGIPSRQAFRSAEEYYSTLFHELTHSTGHSSRIGREGIERLNTFGSESYSKEELIAEMGAAMLAGVASIERRTISNSTAYLQSWVNVLKSDARMVVFAASQAQKAADYIQGARQNERPNNCSL
jgi:antirestriction protein ArdC